MKLFWVVFISKPTKNQERDGTEPEVLWGPKLVHADDANQATLRATRAATKEEVDVSRAEVSVSPF